MVMQDCMTSGSSLLPNGNEGRFQGDDFQISQKTLSALAEIKNLPSVHEFPDIFPRPNAQKNLLSQAQSFSALEWLFFCENVDFAAIQ